MTRLCRSLQINIPTTIRIRYVSEGAVLQAIEFRPRATPEWALVSWVNDNTTATGSGDHKLSIWDGTHAAGGRPWGSHGVMPSRRAAARGHPRARGVHAVAEWMHGAALHRCTRCATHPGDQAYALVSSEHRGPRWREGGSWRELETRLT